MLLISETLEAAQRRPDCQPYVELKAWEKVGEANRLRWSFPEGRFYTGNEADASHAAEVAADGALLRARVAANGGQHDLLYQRVPDPGPEADFAAWTTLVANVSATSGLAFAKIGAKILVCYVAADKRTIYCRESADSGASFGLAAEVAVVSADVNHLAAAFKSATEVALFYAPGPTIYVAKRNEGVWGASAEWSNAAGSITGLACHYSGDWNLALAGADDNAKVWTTIYGDGYSQAAGTWSALAEIMHAASGSGVTFAHTSLARPDVYRLTFREEYAGTGAYARTFASHGVGAADFVENLWREPFPLNPGSAYGLAFCHPSTEGPSTVYLTSPSGVWAAPLSTTVLDLTPDVLSLRSQVGPYGGTLVARCRNEDGRYLDGADGKGQAWLGCELRLGLGYRTAAGNEASTHLSFWVEDYEYEAGGGTASLILYAGGPWSLLSAWKARRQLTWQAGSQNVFQILSFLLSRVGLTLSAIDLSAEVSSLTPAFTVHPGENGAEAVRRLLKRVPDTLRFQNAAGILSNPSDADASTNSYGVTSPIRKGRFRTGASPANRVQVYGSGAFGEAFAWDEVELVCDRLLQVRDQNLSGVDDCAAMAETSLRKSLAESKHDLILTAPNCGLELYDVVDLTEPLAGLAAAKRRVVEITTQYDARKGVYEEEVELGRV